MRNTQINITWMVGSFYHKRMHNSTWTNRQQTANRLTWFKDTRITGIHGMSILWLSRAQNKSWKMSGRFLNCWSVVLYSNYSYPRSILSGKVTCIHLYKTCGYFTARIWSHQIYEKAWLYHKTPSTDCTQQRLCRLRDSSPKILLQNQLNIYILTVGHIG